MREMSKLFLDYQIHKDNQSKTIELTQPALIEPVIKDLGIDNYSKGKDFPVDSILHANLNGHDHIDSWNYQSIDGKLNYLDKNTRPNISRAVHRCAHYCTNPLKV
jgi:hypothetical protein